MDPSCIPKFQTQIDQLKTCLGEISSFAAQTKPSDGDGGESSLSRIQLRSLVNKTDKSMDGLIDAFTQLARELSVLHTEFPKLAAENDKLYEELKSCADQFSAPPGSEKSNSVVQDLQNRLRIVQEEKMASEELLQKALDQLDSLERRGVTSAMGDDGNQINDLQAVMASLKQHYNTAFLNIRTELMQNSDLIERKDAQIKGYSETLEKVKNELITVSNEGDKKDELIRDYQTGLEKMKLQMEKDIEMKQLAEVRASKAETRANAAASDKEQTAQLCHLLQQKIQELDKQLLDFNVSIKDAVNQASDAKAERDVLAIKCKQLEEMVATQKEALAKAMDAAGQRINEEIEKSIQQGQQSIKYLEQERDQGLEELTRVKSQFDRAQREAKLSQHELEKLTRQHQFCTDQASSRDQLDTLTRRACHAESELANVKTQLEALQDRFDRTIEENERCLNLKLSEIENLNVKADGFHSQLRVANQRLENAECLLREKDAEIKKVNEKLLNTERDTKRQLLGVQDDLSNAENSFEAKQGAITKEHAKSLQQLQMLVNAQREALNNWRGQHDKMVEEHELEVKSLRRQLREQHARVMEVAGVAEQRKLISDDLEHRLVDAVNHARRLEQLRAQANSQLRNTQHELAIAATASQHKGSGGLNASVRIS